MHSSRRWYSEVWRTPVVAWDVQMDLWKNFTKRSVQHRNSLPGNVGNPEDFQELAWQSHGWPDIILGILLLWVACWTRQPLEVPSHQHDYDSFICLPTSSTNEGFCTISNHKAILDHLSTQTISTILISQKNCITFFLIRIIPTVHFSILPSPLGSWGTACPKPGCFPETRMYTITFLPSPKRKVNIGLLMIVVILNKSD